MSTVRYGDTYEWDSDKAAQNVVAHGVSFEEAATVLVAPDPVDAQRTLTIGFSIVARVLFVVSTERGDRTRIISARRATRREREHWRTHHEDRKEGSDDE